MKNVIETRNEMIGTTIRDAFRKVCEKGTMVQNLAEAMVAQGEAYIALHGPITVGKHINVSNDAWTIDLDNKVIYIYLAENFETEKDMESLVLRAAAMYRYRKNVYMKRDELIGYICPIDFDIRLVLLGDVRETGNWQRREMENFHSGKFSSLIYVNTIEAYPIFSEVCQIEEHRWLTCTMMPFFNKAEYEDFTAHYQYQKPLPLMYADETPFEHLLPVAEYYRSESK